MIRTCVFLALAVAAVSCDQSGQGKAKQSVDDPFALMDSFVHYVFPPRIKKLWPWFEIFQGTMFPDDSKPVASIDECEIDLFVKKYKPEELRVKVKNRFIIVEGSKKAEDDSSNFFVNRFVQKFTLPAGCNEDEVVAVFDDRMLYLSAPKRELVPLPERIIPIEVKTPDAVETTTEKKEETTTTSTEPLEQLDSEVTASTHGKIRKKELKTTNKATKDNNMTKGDGNDLDYSSVEGSE